MAAITLVQYIQELTDQTDPTTAVLSEDMILEILRGHRILGYYSACKAINRRDHSLRIDTTSGVVSLNMFDSGGGTGQFYDREFKYHLYPDGLTVLVDGVEVSSTLYTFYPISCSLKFTTPLADPSSKVVVRGIVVNMVAKGAIYHSFYTLADKASTLISVRGTEFEDYPKRLRTSANQRWAARIIYFRK